MPRVTYDDIKSYYGGVPQAKAALGVKSKQTLYNWQKDGVPAGWQALIHLRTGGALKADEAVIAGPGARCGADEHAVG